VAQIKKAADRAATLTRQLLAFSRKQAFSPQVVNFNRIVEDSSRMLARIIGEDISFDFLPGEALKPIKVDPGQMEQILANFAANARDAMPNGGRLIIETANVVTSEHRITGHGELLPGAYVVLKAKDNGVGMTGEVMERIFEPFFTTKEKGKGTGLGLATVYGIVRQNGGNILVYSTPGEGTVFEVYFPLADSLPVETERGITEAPPKGSATVMVAEDEDTVRNLTTRILERNGYRVISAANAEEALVLWSDWRQDVDFLLTDVIMPGLNGLELFNRLKDDKPELQVLYMSGYPEDVIADHGMNTGTVQLLEKPFSPDKLLTKIREILDANTAAHS
jgi:CheY-like chemotaxis protein